MEKPTVTAEKKNSTVSHYLSLATVIVIWGISPVINPYLYTVYSPTVCSGISGFVAALSLLFINCKDLKYINKNYIKIAIPTGIINSLAAIIQKIGLLYTTPARYAFLENLSCVVVPVMMFVLVRKKPTAIKVFSSVLCLVGCFVLAGADMSGRIGVGELLCSVSGLLYGVNIALTAVYATRLNSRLYVLLHMVVHVAVSLITTVSLNFIEIEGEAVEAVRFEWNIGMLLIIAFMAILSNSICWTLRTNAMKVIDATVVSVMMPFSAVVTGVLSAIVGFDSISPGLIIGAVIVLAASMLSGLGDHKK